MHVLVIIAFAAAGSLFVLAPDICALLGEKYTLVSPALRILSVNMILWVLESHIGSAFLTACSYVKGRRNTIIMSVGVRVILTLAFCPKFGASVPLRRPLLPAHARSSVMLRACGKPGMPVRLEATTAKSIAAGLAAVSVAFFFRSDLGIWATLITLQITYVTILILFARRETTAAVATVRQIMTGR